MLVEADPLQVTDIVFDYESLTGTIPSDLGLYQELSVLSLRGNHLTGSIPTEIASLQKLTNMDLGNNTIDGKIPTGLLVGT